MGNKTEGHTGSKRLPIFILLSIVLHGLLFSYVSLTIETQTKSTSPFNISLTIEKSEVNQPSPQQKRPLEQTTVTDEKTTLQDGTTSKPFPAQSQINQLSKPASNERLPATLGAATLIIESRKLIQDKLFTDDRSGRPHQIVQIPPLEALKSDKHAGNVEAYRISAGEMKIRLSTLLAGEQCFEAPVLPSLNELEEIIWRHSRC